MRNSSECSGSHSGSTLPSDQAHTRLNPRKLWKKSFRPLINHGHRTLCVSGVLSGVGQAIRQATVPLGLIVGGSIIYLGNVFAILSTLTSYIGFAFSLTDEYQNAIVHWGKFASRYATLTW